MSYKVSHELRAEETDPQLADLVDRLRDTVVFDGRRILYNWLGATRRDWRGQGHFRALTEEQEVWAVAQGFDEVLVKTKNRYYDMRGTLDSLQFDVIKLEPRRGRPRLEGVFEQAPRARSCSTPIAAADWLVGRREGARGGAARGRGGPASAGVGGTAGAEPPRLVGVSARLGARAAARRGAEGAPQAPASGGRRGQSPPD